MLGIQKAAGVAVCWVVAGFIAEVANADSPKEKLQRAYYLENHDGNFAAAEKLYAELVKEPGLEEADRAEAKRRRDGCREEAAVGDFARLMPPNAWAYAELSRPGDHLLRLIDQLGLLRGNEKSNEKVANRLSISPELVDGLLGIRGAAACLTGFDMQREIPAGVAIIHPGKLDVLRAALETALPVQFAPCESIDGYDTYHIEGEVFVTLTARLIVASPQRAEIEGVIARLKGEESESLAGNPDVADALKSRGDNLLLAFANFKPMMPLIQTGLAAAATQERELATIAALFDPRSLQSLVAKVGIAKDGPVLDIALNLADGHRNLIFDFVNLPPVDARTLKLVPSGAAAFAAMALNEADKSVRPIEGSSEPTRNRRVSALDIGREVFHNVLGICAFVLPTTSKIGGLREPIPDFAIVMTTRDPARSEALWEKILGIAGLAAGTASNIDGAALEISGAKARRFALPDGIAVYMAVRGDALVLSPSQNAISRALTAQAGGASVLSDAEFSKAAAGLTSDTSLAVIAHGGRCLELARNFVSPHDRDAAEIARFGELLKGTAASLILEQGENRLRIAAKVSGLPNVSGLITQLINERRGGSARQRIVRHAVQTGDIQPALAAINETMIADDTQPRGELLRQKFELLAGKEDQHAAALNAGDALYAALAEDSGSLNDFAWKLVTDQRYSGRFNDLALRMSQRSNALSENGNWMHLDTLAHVRFAMGDIGEAIELEQRAIAFCKDNRRHEAEAALRKFEEAQRRATTVDAR